MDSMGMELEQQLERLEKQMRGVEELKWDEIVRLLQELSGNKKRSLYGRVCYYAAYYMFGVGRTEETMRYLNECLSYLIGTNEVRDLARCYNMLGIIAHGQNNLTLAMEQYDKALEYAEQYEDIVVKNGILSNMADAYCRIGAYERAVQCYEECLGSYGDITDNYTRAIVNYRKMLASYGYCLLMIDKLEAATAIADKLLGMSCNKNCELTTRLGTYTFLAFLYHKRNEPGREKMAVGVAMDVVSKMEQVSAEVDEVLNLVYFLSITKRKDCLCEVLPDLERRAAMEQNGGLLLQLLLVHMNDCCDDMEPDEFYKNARLFQQVKEECEKTENEQSIRMLELRNKIYRMEKEQKTLEQTNTKLLYQVDHDELSGLCNKNCLNMYLEEAFDEALQKQTPLTIFFLDIDFFKQINDYYGHQKGDECIRTVAEILLECMPEDFVARYGGDEFVVVMRGRSREYVTERAERLLEQVRAKAIPHACSPESDIMTITAGIVHSVPKPRNRVWDFLSAADETLYLQKNERKGCVRFYQETSDSME